MKPLILVVISFLLTAFPLWVVAGEPSWATPSNIKFENIKASDRIIPLGFSKKGVFSYILQQNSCRGSSGTNQKLSWIAIDLVKDKVVEQADFEMEPPNLSVEKVMRKYAKRIEDYNSKYGIVTAEFYKIAVSTVIKSEKDVLAIQTELVEIVEGEDSINPGYQKYHISLWSRKHGIKKLSEIKSIYKPLRFWGYLKSPFEERIAVLFLSDFRGCEAFPQMRINIVGANLIRGFVVERGE